METLLYIMGYILVVLYILFAFDDFIWDIITLFRKRGYKKNHIELSELESSPPKMLAVMIGAWHESNVIKNVVENLIASTNYPISMYHVFVGVYPNDSATIRQVEILEKEFSNVHMVINDKKGPTSKAQNLNYVIREIKKYEIANHISFASFTIHDSEDVIHPYELLMTNYMIDKHDAIQFPVFPIISMPKFKNFFKNITTCTYADEFAENHFSTLVGRYVTGAFVPSAGTGFALSRKTILSFGDEDVLPANSQTEDYKLSLILYEKGIQMHYILEKIPRVTHNFKIKYDYITTRSLFPNTYKSAIKQKTRWIYGITMQSARLRDVLFNNNLSVAGRYSLYKDLKAKYGNLIIFFGYIIMIYWIASFFMNLPPVYVKGTVPYYLCFIVTGMMILRQFYRAIAITNVYGFRSMFFACLFPPLFPIRLIYGNIINFVSTVKAYEQKYFFEETKKRKEKNKDKDKREGEYKKTRVIKWAHTDHEFLDFEILKRYHRNLGDTLLMKGYVDPDTLLDSLTSALELHQRIGTYLLNKKIINETQLMDALATTQHRVFIDNNTIKKIIHSKLINKKDIKFYEDNHVVPLLRREDTIIFGITNDTVEDIKDILSKYYGVNVYTVYITKTALNNALNHVYENDKFDYVTKIYKDNRISSEQYVLILKYSILGKIKDEELINKLGIQ